MEGSAQKLGLNARHGNFSAISRDRLWDLYDVQNETRRSSPLGKILPGMFECQNLGFERPSILIDAKNS